MADSYKINLPFFTGPFDLLLSLVKAHDMDIYDVNINEVIDQYLAYIEMAKLCDLELAGEFLVMAATLMRIKSRTLLPESPFDQEEEDDELAEEISEIQSARQLIAQLVEYRKYKELSVDLGEREAHQSNIFYRTRMAPPPDNGHKEEISTDLALLLKALSRVLNYVDSQKFHEVVRETWSVEEKSQDVLERLRDKPYLDVTDLFKRCVHKLELIVVFLALLDLCRQNKIRIRQSANFQDIHVFKSEEQLDHVGTE